MTDFAGYLSTFDQKGDGDQIMDEGVLIEVLDLKKDGSVELAYNDRNERVYLTFRLQDLMRVMCEHANE